MKMTPAELTGFLDRGTAVTGELRFSGAMRIDGEYHGSISTDDILMIGEYARVHADIRAGEVEIRGKLSGSVNAARRIEIRSTGRVVGDLRTPVLVVDEGGALEGQSRMGQTSEGSADSSRNPSAFEGVDEVN